MPIAVGILFIGATEFEIHVGGNFTPPPLDIRSVKKILDTGGLKEKDLDVIIRQT